MNLLYTITYLNYSKGKDTGIRQSMPWLHTQRKSIIGPLLPSKSADELFLANKAP